MLVDCPTCEHYETCEQEDRWYSVACINYKALPTKNPTNADRIRAMSDEELASLLQPICPPIPRCPDEPPHNCRMCVYNWLKQEATP